MPNNISPTIDLATRLSNLHTSSEKPTFPTLPPEVLTLVVRHLANRQAPVWPWHVLASSTTNFEDQLASPSPGLIVLSEVSSFFWELCKPELWKSVDLTRRSNANILYFLCFLLPRHGIHVRTLRAGMGLAGQNSFISEHLSKSLGIKSWSNPFLPPPIPLDLRILGEQVLAPLVRGRSGNWTAVDPVAVQCAKLLALIISSSHLSNLNSLSVNIFGSKDIASTTFASFRNSMAARPSTHRPATLGIQLYLRRVGVRDDAPLQNAQHSLAGLLETCVDARDVRVSLWESQPEGTGQVRPELVSLSQMDKLERLCLLDPHIQRNWSTVSWRANLTHLKMDYVKGGLEDVMLFVGVFKATLRKLDIHYPQDESDDLFDPDVFTPNNFFPKLIHINLVTIFPSHFIRYFRDSPLEIIPLSHVQSHINVGLGVEEWGEIIADHGESLKEVHGEQGKFTEQESKEVAEMAMSCRNLKTFKLWADGEGRRSDIV